MKNPSKPVGWFEIYVTDMARARAFYEATFQIQLEHLPSPNPNQEIEMWMFPGAMDMDAPGCSGALCRMKECQPGGSGTIIYFTCADCAVEAGRAAENGGRIYQEKMPIGQYGFIAIIADSEGNTIGLHSMN
ncbi:MAG: VOC family protein [Terrimicrobiaceae bacterium]|nr:VOC family protein [Terrimicrobiaceae bacterium]